MDVILNTRLMTYDIKVSRYTGCRVRGYGYSDNTTLAVVITNLLACIQRRIFLSIVVRQVVGQTVRKVLQHVRSSSALISFAVLGM